jgi:hypothetical protein
MQWFLFGTRKFLTIMLIQIMILSLPNVENILIDRKFFTRDELKKLKESRHYGRGRCRVLGTFKRAVKENYELFFPEQPCQKSFSKNAEKLFRVGADRDFPASETTPAIPSERKRRRTSIDYREEEDPVEEQNLSQASKFFIKASQEKKIEGKGSNNPRHSLETRHIALAKTAAGTSVPEIERAMKANYDDFGIFNDQSDSILRTPLPSRTLYRVRENLPLAILAQQREFVRRASRLTLSTDGVSTLNRDF